MTSAEVTPNAGDCKGILPKMTLIQVQDYNRLPTIQETSRDFRYQPVVK